MSTKAAFTFSLSTALVDQVKALLINETLHPTLGLSTEHSALKPDAKGLLPEDYKQLQSLAKSQKEGDDLLDEVLAHPKIGRQARQIFNDTQRKNRRVYERTLAQRPLSLSGLIETLIIKGLEQCKTPKATKNASIKSASRKSGDARKVA